MLEFSDTTASARHPFIGLRPFRIDDARFFFGREEQIEALTQLIETRRLVSVIGSSGSGKSSLVHAGLPPRLAAAGWCWVEMRPGDSPIRNLAEALAKLNKSSGSGRLTPLEQARADRIELVIQQSSLALRDALPLLPDRSDRLMIVVDQFEEIFRFADLRAQRALDPRRAAEKRDEATLFIQLLLNAVEDELPIEIVLTMRSDFIGECARFHGLSEAVTTTQTWCPH